MRKSAYILIGLILSVCANAQPRLKTPEYWVGVHGGVSGSTVLFNPKEDGMSPIINACVLGGNGGLAFRYAGHKYCHFQMELNYMHRGWASYTESSGHVYRNLHYIELPILMNLNFGSEGCKWFFNLGPQIGYCILDRNAGIDHPFDWGLAAGTGVYVRTPHAGVYELEIRADFSFGGIYGTSLIDHYRMASPLDLSVNLGWYFPIKRTTKQQKYEN